MKLHAIIAAFLRNVASFFSGALGYLVIVVFVFVCAILGFSERFFANNLANLDQLSQWYPELLLFLVPAITMGLWADERKQNTDELLFTLPASDVDILLGKYFACVANYTIALLFTMPLLFVLNRIGNPDWGVIFTTYLGYWFAGATLLSAGMFASSLTRSTTVAFVVGVLVAAVPVYFSETMITGVTGFLAKSAERYGWLVWLANALNWFGDFLGVMAESMLLDNQLRGFTEGLIPLSSILYFISFTSFMLYLNYVVITRRHWSSGRQTQMGLQYAVRVLALVAVLVSFNSMLRDGNAFVPSGVDLSGERVHSLSKVTNDMIDRVVEAEEPITIHAFVSPDLPEEFSVIRKELDSLMRQYDRLGGSWISIRIVDVEHAGASEREAIAQGITPINHKLSDREGRVVQQQVYMGVVVEGSKNRVVIPHIDDAARIEYELTHSLATVTKADKLRIGILRTDARVLNMGKDWYFDQFIAELKKQYELVDVSHADLKKRADDTAKKPDAKKKSKTKKKEADKKEEKKDKPLDVLLVVQPSSLTRNVMQDLVKYIKAGKPTLLLDDPLPFYLIYDQARFPEELRADFNEILSAPRLARAHPRSYWSIELLPRSVYDELVRRWTAFMRQQRRRPSQQQVEFAFMRMVADLYPEVTPQISAFSQAPKADDGRATILMDALGLSWNYDRVVTDRYQPHPEFVPAIAPQHAEQKGATWPVKEYGQIENAFLFINRGNGDAHALNATHDITQGLQEVLGIYAGSVFRKSGQSKTNVLSLLRTSKNSSVILWDDLTSVRTQQVAVLDPETQTIRGEERKVPSRLLNGARGIDPRRQLPEIVTTYLADDPVKTPSDKHHSLAVLVTSEDETKDKKKSTGGIKAIFVADIDMITNVYFNQQKALGRPLDNISFVQNSIEWLADDGRFIPLRSRRQRLRTLVAVQEAVDGYRQDRLDAERAAKAARKKAGEDAEKRFEDKLKEIQERKGLGIFERSQMASVALRAERERLKSENRKLDEDLKKKLAELKDREDREIRSYQARVRAVAIAFTPIPAILLGILVFCIRWYSERRKVVSSRRV